MEDKKQKKKNDIIVSEDKLRLSLRDYKMINRHTSSVWVYLGLAISFFIPLITAEFKGFLGIDANIIKACFIILSAIFFVLFIICAIKIIHNKIKSKGDEDWFIYHIQGLEKPLKVKHERSWSFMEILGRILQVLLYLAPIILWIIVISLIGWDVAWGTSITEGGETSYTWGVTLLFSSVWFVGTYLILIVYKDYINDWFDETF